MLSDGLSKVWGARRDSELFDRIDSKLGTLAEYATSHETLLREFVVPGIKDMMSRNAEFQQRWPVAIAAMEQTAKAVDGMALRLVRLEQSMERWEHETKTRDEKHSSTFGGLSARIDSVSADVARQQNRIEQLEVKNRDEVIVSHALTTRTKLLITIGTVAGGAVAGVLSQIKTILGWFH